METTFAPVKSIFNDTDIFTRYRMNATFIDWVIGGVPQKPEIIESWLRTRILGGDEELRLALIKTLGDLEIAVPADATREQIIEAASKIAATRNGNTFRRDELGRFFLSAYQVKAMLKESINIQFAGERWGKLTKDEDGRSYAGKGPRNYFAERVFLDEQRIPLGRDAVDGTHMQIGHVNGPKGPRSTLTYYDYCAQPEITITVSSLNDCITRAQWESVLKLSQRLGLGALRSLGYGQFAITGFEKV